MQVRQTVHAFQSPATERAYKYVNHGRHSRWPSTIDGGINYVTLFNSCSLSLQSANRLRVRSLAHVTFCYVVSCLLCDSVRFPSVDKFASVDLAGRSWRRLPADVNTTQPAYDFVPASLPIIPSVNACRTLPGSIATRRRASHQYPSNVVISRDVETDSNLTSTTTI